MWEDASYVWTRLVFQRGLALVYLIAFLAAAFQFRPLLGEWGLLPVPQFVKRVSFLETPSVFHFFVSDKALAVAAWLGVLLSLAAFVGVSEKFGAVVSMTVWGLLWLLYLSFVNVGQTFYGFGWESLLLEAGFFSIFFGAASTKPPELVVWMLRWLLFRVMFGAGLIKLRGDPCWRDLTCLFWHYETQPLPNPLSWYFNVLPQWVHKGGVLFNHFVELVVPFGYFAPFPFNVIAGAFTILFQASLTLSGNLSFLNLLTIVLALATFDDRVWGWLPWLKAPPLQAIPVWQSSLVYTLAAGVALLSIKPIQNMLSSRQMMNASFNQFHLVGTYGAFGAVTRPRYEVVVQGTAEGVLGATTKWREYEFKGKPGALNRLPPQIAPYHLRLDWLMWFEALHAGAGSRFYSPWFVHFIAKLLQNDSQTLTLIRENPFSDQPPTHVRALLYRYRFTTPEERRANGNWWQRDLVGEYLPPLSLDDPALQKIMESFKN